MLGKNMIYVDSSTLISLSDQCLKHLQEIWGREVPNPNLQLPHTRGEMISEILLARTRTPGRMFVDLGKLVDRKGAATVLHVSESCIAKYTYRCGMPHIVLAGGRRNAIRYHVDEIMEWKKRRDTRSRKTQ